MTLRRVAIYLGCIGLLAGGTGLAWQHTTGRTDAGSDIVVGTRPAHGGDDARQPPRVTIGRRAHC